MNEFLSELLPSEFEVSKTLKNAFEVNDYGIVRSVWLEKSNFYPKSSSWIIRISVDFESNYCEIPMFLNHIVDVSVMNNEIHVTEGNLNKLNHWGENDRENLSGIVRGLIIPWIEYIGKPEIFVDFLERSMTVGLDGKDSQHREEFGDIIMCKQYDPPRLRKVNLGFLATINERMSKFDKALEYLLQFKPFYESDNMQNIDEEHIAAKHNILKKIDESITEYSRMSSS